MACFLMTNVVSDISLTRLPTPVSLSYPECWLLAQSREYLTPLVMSGTPGPSLDSMCSVKAGVGTAWSDTTMVKRKPASLYYFWKYMHSRTQSYPAQT